MAGNITPEVAARIDAAARRLVDDLTRAPAGSPTFKRAMRSVDRIGEREIRATTAIAARFSDRPASAIEEILAEQSPLTRHVREVRELAAAFSRLGRASSASDRKRLAVEVGRREDEIRTLAQALEDDRSALMTDNAVLDQQERALGTQTASLEQLAALCARLDELIVERIALIAITDPETARVLEAETLYTVRQRRRDLLLQLAVATQGRTTLRRIEQGNIEVIRALRSAATTTLTALRTAGLALRALDDERTGADAWAELLSSLDAVDQQRQASLSDIRRGGRRAP